MLPSDIIFVWLLVFSGTDRMNKMEIELNFYTHVKNTNKLTKGSLFVAVVSTPYNAEPGEGETSVSCTRDGYTELGIVGFSGLTGNCIGRQFFLSEGKAYITIHNKGTSIQTGTCNIRVLYREN